MNSILKKNGITALVLGTAMEGLQLQFWSHTQACMSKDGVVWYDFKNPERGFPEGNDDPRLKRRPAPLPELQG